MERQRISALIDISVIAVICIIALNISCYFLLKMPLHRVLSVLASKLYLPISANLFPVPAINGQNVMVSFYFAIALSSLMTFLYLWLRNAPAPFGQNPAVVICIIFFLIFSVIQLPSQTGDLKKHMKNFSGKTLREKQELLFGLPYKFAAFCNEKYPGAHKARMMTDLDLKKASPMIYHRRLAFFLYPIDIRGVTDLAEDCIVVTFKIFTARTLRKKPKAIYSYDKFNHLIVLKD